MPLLDDLGNLFRAEGYELILLSETMFGLQDENGAAAFTIEVTDGWTHLRQALNLDGSAPSLQQSLLLANDRMLGFRFSIDEDHNIAVVRDILPGENDLEIIVDVAEHMMECIPYYQSVFLELQKSRQTITQAQLDDISDALNGKAN